MHELGLCSSIVEVVERRAQGRPVARVRVRVGCLHHVHPDAFDQSFALAAAGGVADGASAELVILDAAGTCRGCGTSFAVHHPMDPCPACGEPEVVVAGGDELTLELIEYRR